MAEAGKSHSASDLRSTLELSRSRQHYVEQMLNDLPQQSRFTQTVVQIRKNAGITPLLIIHICSVWSLGPTWGHLISGWATISLGVAICYFMYRRPNALLYEILSLHQDEICDARPEGPWYTDKRSQCVLIGLLVLIGASSWICLSSEEQSWSLRMSAVSVTCSAAGLLNSWVAVEAKVIEELKQKLAETE